MELFMCFFFKQKTAYEMRISDWSSDVCSSDLDQHEDRRFGKRRFEFHDEIEFVAVGNAAIQQHYVIGIGLLRYFESALRAVGFLDVQGIEDQIGRASCRERVCQYV